MASLGKGFNGERLRAARRYKGLKITELAELADVSKQAISQFEYSKSEPKTETILKIVKVLGFPREYFYQESSRLIYEGDTYFRSLSTLSSKSRWIQIEYVNLLADVFHGVENYITFPKLNLPDVKSDFDFDVEKLADEVRRYWNLKDPGIFNLIDVLERNGVVINTLKTNNDKIDAYSQIRQIDGNILAIIVLGDDKESSFRRNFSVAHELGHLLLDDFFNLSDMTKIEYKEMEDLMNRFAGALLIPKDTYLLDLKTGNKTDLSFYIQLKLKYGVSASALIVRARQLGEITNNQYQYLMKQLSQKGYRRCEPYDKETPLIAPRYIKQAMKMIIEEDKVTGKEFLRVLTNSGTAFSPELVEEILGLDAGYLSQNDEKAEVLNLARKGQ